MQLITGVAALGAVVLVCLIVYRVFKDAWPAMQEFGLGFITTNAWSVVTNEFGAAAFIFGTLFTSISALIVAAPVSIAIGLFLSELAPNRVRGPIGMLVELLAAIPSVVLGLWGILVLGPFLAQHLEPWLHDHLGFIPIFGPPSPTGTGLFTAGLILTIMVVPIVASICRELFLQVPDELEEGALALGSTRWEMVRGVILPATRTGIAAAIILGLGRALGETMAVTMLIGNRHDISFSVLQPAYTMAAAIANEFSEATTSLYLSALFEVGLILFVVTVVVNAVARWLIWRVARGTAVGSRAL